jgi:hypothetical protein
LISWDSTTTMGGNQDILVGMDSSTFVAFYPVRNVNATISCDILESRYFTDYGCLSLLFQIMRRFQVEGIL